MTIREHLEAIVDSFDYLESAEHAQAVLDLIDNGVEMRRIGRAFYDDTDEGQPVLVIPLEFVDARGDA